MRPVTQRFSVAGLGAPVMVNYIQNAFALALYIYFSGTTLACKVQLSGDDPSQNRRQPGIPTVTRVTTTATVVDTAHNLVNGSTIFVQGAGAPFDTGPAGADITVVDANTYTYTVANSGLAAGQNGFTLAHLRWFDHATLGAVAASANGNVAFPVRAVRLNIATLTAGLVDFIVEQGAFAS